MRRHPIALLMMGMAACSSPSEPWLPDLVELPYDFMSGAQSWTAAFTDYPVGAESQMQLTSGLQLLPAPLDTTRTAYMLSGVNHSDDVFMYLRRSISSLRPNATYEVGYRVEFATNAPRGCAGIGGAPGESVVVKVGASTAEPVPVVVAGEYRLSVDKGEQHGEGTAAIVIGDVASNSTSCNGAPYAVKVLDSAPRTVTAQTDANGRLWLFVGVESGFEGETRIYITRIIVTFERVR
jgi:hypothetical protein